MVIETRLILVRLGSLNWKQLGSGVFHQRLFWRSGLSRACGGGGNAVFDALMHHGIARIRF
jgi:hypothetical protein